MPPPPSNKRPRPLLNLKLAPRALIQRFTVVAKQTVLRQRQTVLRRRG